MLISRACSWCRNENWLPHFLANTHGACLVQKRELTTQFLAAIISLVCCKPEDQGLTPSTSIISAYYLPSSENSHQKIEQSTPSTHFLGRFWTQLTTPRPLIFAQLSSISPPHTRPCSVESCHWNYNREDTMAVWQSNNLLNHLSEFQPGEMIDIGYTPSEEEHKALILIINAS